MSSAGTLSLPSCFTLVCVCLYAIAACCLKVYSPIGCMFVLLNACVCVCVWPENLVRSFPSLRWGSAPTHCPFPFFINQTSYLRPFPFPAHTCTRSEHIANLPTEGPLMYQMYSGGPVLYIHFGEALTQDIKIHDIWAFVTHAHCLKLFIAFPAASVTDKLPHRIHRKGARKITIRYTFGTGTRLLWRSTIPQVRHRGKYCLQWSLSLLIHTNHSFYSSSLPFFDG